MMNPSQCWRPSHPAEIQKGALMKCVIQTTALVLFALIMVSCTTTNMVQVWRNPSYTATPVKRIFVVAIIPQEGYRAIFESALTRALNNQGYLTRPSFSVFPPGQLNREQVTAYVKAQSIDLVVVMRLSKQTDVQYVPPTVTYVPPPAYFGGWYGFYGYGYNAVYSPGYYAENTIVVAETNVYSAHSEPEPLVWSGSSSTFNFSHASDAADSVADALVSDLTKAGILVK
jgi:hypothetical protein